MLVHVRLSQADLFVLLIAGDHIRSSASQLARWVRVLQINVLELAMIDQQWAQAFAKDWIASWNAHDMDRILSHYTDDFEISSPLIVERLDVPEGKLKGKKAVCDYWQPSLKMSPPLQFELIDVFVGIDAITLYYHNVGRRMVAETLFINLLGKVTHGIAQWSIVKI